MTTQPGVREIARHEAYHAAAFLLQGMTPLWARIDRPDDETLGACRPDWGDGPDRPKARVVLIGLLAGALTEGYNGWKQWPIDPDRIAAGARADAEQARLLAGYLDLEEPDWLHIVWQANKLAGSTDFRRLVVAITNELEHVEYLDGDQLRKLQEEICST